MSEYLHRYTTERGNGTRIFALRRSHDRDGVPTLPKLQFLPSVHSMLFKTATNWLLVPIKFNDIDRTNVPIIRPLDAHSVDTIKTHPVCVFLTRPLGPMCHPIILIDHYPRELRETKTKIKCIYVFRGLPLNLLVQ